MEMLPGIVIMLVVGAIVRMFLAYRHAVAKQIADREDQLRQMWDRNDHFNNRLAEIQDRAAAIVDALSVDERRLDLPIYSKVPQKPRRYPRMTPSRVPLESLSALQRQRIRVRIGPRMPCQGSTVPGHSVVEWHTSHGIKACMAYLKIADMDSPQTPDDPGADRYEWIEVTTFGNPETKWVRGPTHPTPSFRPDHRLSNPQQR
jgi:hypothetical protein